MERLDKGNHRRLERLHQRLGKGRLHRRLERSMVGRIVRRLGNESHLHLDGEENTDDDLSSGYVDWFSKYDDWYNDDYGTVGPCLSVAIAVTHIDHSFSAEGRNTPNDFKMTSR